MSVAAAALVVGAWGWSPPARASDEATFKFACEAAAAARKAAGKAGYEWLYWDISRSSRMASTPAAAHSSSVSPLGAPLTPTAP